MWHVEIRMRGKASPIQITFVRDHCPKCQYLIQMTDSETQFYIADSNISGISELKGPSMSGQFTTQETEPLRWCGMSNMTC